MANNNITSNITFGAPYETEWDKAQNAMLREKREAKEKLARQRAQAKKQKPPKKKVKPANWEQMLDERPKTSLTPEEYFEKIR
jgi:hypothetical protein